MLFLIIALVISAAWPLYVYVNTPKISMAVAHEEVSAWEYDWARPIYYYLNFPLFAGAWIILLATYFIKPFSQTQSCALFQLLFSIDLVSGHAGFALHHSFKKRAIPDAGRHSHVHDDRIACSFGLPAV